MPDPTDPFRYRLLRRPDVPSYLKVVLQAVGNLERATGLDQAADAMVRMLSHRSTWLVLEFLQFFHRSPVEVYAAIEEGKVAGTGTNLYLRKTAYVAGIATDAQYRGRGIASRILAILRESGVRRHRAWLVLDTESDNETALRVYRRAGYREVLRFSWFVRTGLPPAPSPNPSAASLPRPAGGRELERVLPVIEGARDAEYRAALPGTARMVSHCEILMTGRKVRKQTWIGRDAGGHPSIVLRARYVPEFRLGSLFPVTGPNPPAPEEVASLLGAATEWLRPLAPQRCLVAVMEPAGVVGTTLEGLGFARVASSTTMIRSSAA